ncbi:MAG: hypothetical protein QOE64_172 [Frankiales bacterium]|nr:hypothetical protein [Frankiales bacterium]
MRVSNSRRAESMVGPGPEARSGGARDVWGIRKQSALIAVVVVTAALLGGVAVLLLVLQSSLTSAARTSLAVRSTDVARLLEEQGVDETQVTVGEDRRGGEQVQVIGPDGRVVVSTDRRLRSQPMSTLRPAPGGSASEELASLAPLGDTDDFLLNARGVTVGGGDYVVLVAVPVQVQADTVRTVGLFLLGATPLVVALVGAAVWVLVGRSLQTVDRIRRQVSEIDARRLDERIEVPATADEIAALASTMNVMLDRLERFDRWQRAFFSDASHELRSPLATLVTTAEVASLDPTGRTWLEMQQVLLAESRRLQILVEDLLTIAKVDAGGLRMDAEDVDLEEVLDGEVRRLRTVSDLRVRADLQPVRVTGDEMRLAQVLRNVLDNAARHAVTTVAVETHRRGGEVVVWVDDDGDPIPLADRERVFERFVRLDASRSVDSGGSGPGLAIARAVVTAHGGSIVATEVDGRCRFEIVLPIQA